jgi:catechol 2,3-dioxygenase-like lactoylglutathione lyase family enzyme
VPPLADISQARREIKQEGSVDDRRDQRRHTGHPRDATSCPVLPRAGVAQPAERRWSWWGRVIFYVADVDALYDRALAAGYQPATAPRDAEWGERFFHLIDPDGHELSFARPLLPVSVQ